MQSEHPEMDLKSATWPQLQTIEFNSSVSKALNSSYLKSLELTHEQRQQEMKEKRLLLILGIRKFLIHYI